MTRPQHNDRRHAPRQEITREDLAGIYTRNDHARHVIAGCMSAMPAASELWEQVDRALSDVPALGAVTARLAADLADLVAAMRAALAAHADGESDPLYYVRDELDARQARAAGHGEAP